MITVRLYLYDNTKVNNLGEELKNVLIGSKYINPLDDTNDTAEISVNANPRKEPYPQLTKFIVEISDGEETHYKHYELRYDLVERLGVANELYKHSLYLGNPAISCQKRSVDNFAISYKLKDVSIDSNTFNENMTGRAINGSYVGSDNITTALNPNNSKFGEHKEIVNEWQPFVFLAQLKYVTQQQHFFLWDLTNYHWGKYANGKVFRQYMPTQSFNNTVGILNKAIILDKTTDGLTDESITKLNNYAQAQNVRLQVAKVSGKNYGTYIDQPPCIDSNGYFRYEVPVLYARNSDSLAGDIYTGGGQVRIGTDKIIVPTKTIITELDMLTGNSTKMEYISRIGHPSQYDYTDISNDSSFNSQIGRRTYREEISGPNGFPTFYGDCYWDTNPFRDYDSTVDSVGFKNDILYFNLGGNDQLHEGKFGYTTDAKGKLFYSNVGLRVNNTQIIDSNELDPILSANNEIIKFLIKENCRYTIRTEAYFGNNDVDRYSLNLQPLNERADLGKTTFGLASEMQGSNNIPNNACVRNVYYSSMDRDKTICEYRFVNGSDIYVSFEFQVLAPNNIVHYIIKPSTKPTTYDLFIKAQACNYPKRVDTGFYSTLGDKILPYVVDDTTKNKMQSVELIEDTYQDKNLWEIFMQIGKYLHAKPYIKFFQDKYQLCFRDYGISEVSSKNATNNSIFSSNEIESYVSSLDSYVSNMLQRGNEITEIIVPKENDGSHICVTDNAVIKTKYPILEILSLKARHKNASNSEFVDITDYVFEHNVYKLLPIIKDTSIASYNHYAGNSIYYHINQKQIMGLQYKSPDATDVKPYAIKQLLYDVGFGNYYGDDVGKVCVNDFTFMITYRTSDDVRIKTFKPDLRKFMQNSGTDDFPIQTQYSNQKDKMIDSKKLGENLYGTLLRSGNTSKDRFEYVTKLADIKEAGELYRVDDNNYYVAKNTMIIYPSQIQCEVEYSKDYNKLSEIIGIDSQPRFYEIAETGAIKRDIVFDSFLTLKTGATAQGDVADFRYNSFRNGLQFSMCQNLYKNVYACTFFKGAIKDKDTESNNFQMQVVTPTLIFNNAHTLTIEWDMEDNFSAGSYYTNVSDDVSKVLTKSSWLYPVLDFINQVVVQKISDTNYTEANQVQYCDVYGKADLVDFALVTVDDPFTEVETRAMPKLNREGDTSDQQVYRRCLTGATAFRTQQTFNDLCANDKGFYIDKDNRETLGLNLNIHMLTDSDRFIISSLFWEKKLNNDNQIYSDYKIVFLADEVNKFSKDTILENEILEMDDLEFNSSQAYFGDMTDGANRWVFGTILPYKHITESRWNQIKDKVKAIAIVFEIQPTLYDITKSSMKYIWARNVTGLDTTYLNNANDNANEKLSAVSYIPTWEKD